MQRIARQSRQYDNPALSGHAELHKALRRALPPSTVNLYASPRVQADSIVEWYSELNGQPVPLAQLEASNPQQAASVRRLLAERLAGVKQVLEHLVAQADNPAQGERLRTLLDRASQPPEDKNVYVLDGQPVITAWGIDTPAPPPPVAPPAPVAPRPRRIWPWLLLVLALLLAGLLAWWYYRQPEPPAPPPPPVQQPEPPPAPEPPPPPPPPPPDPVAELRRRIQEAGSNCTALLHLQVTEPLLKTHAELRAEFTQQRLTHCRTDMIAEARQLCPGERLPELAPELFVIMDASGSINQATLDTTRRVMRELGAKLAADVGTGFAQLRQCPSAKSFGFFPPEQREQFIKKFRTRVTPSGDAPLADALRRAGAKLDGVNRESMILVLADVFDESCGGDPCAVARKLAREKPHLTINVVYSQTTSANRCLANATGGQVFATTNAARLNALIQQAAQDVLPPAHCSP